MPLLYLVPLLYLMPLLYYCLGYLLLWLPFALVFNTIGIWHSLRFATGCVSYFVVSNLIFVVTFFESFFASEFQVLCIGC